MGTLDSETKTKPTTTITDVTLVSEDVWSPGHCLLKSGLKPYLESDLRLNEFRLSHQRETSWQAVCEDFSVLSPLETRVRLSKLLRGYLAPGYLASLALSQKSLAI